MQGKVKWFDPHKGFGFISGEDGNDYFVHQSNIRMDGFRKLYNNDEVAFEIDVDDQGRSHAVEVVPQTLHESRA